MLALVVLLFMASSARKKEYKYEGDDAALASCRKHKAQISDVLEDPLLADSSIKASRATFLVTGARIWVAPRVQTGSCYPDIIQLFRQARPLNNVESAETRSAWRVSMH